MIRTVLVILFIVIFFILSLPLILVEWIISLIRPNFVKRRVIHALVQCALRIIGFLAGIRKTVIGRDRVPRDEAVLYVGNHQSFFDVVVAYGNVPTLTGFISKKEFQKIPILPLLMKYLNCQFLDRDDIRQAMEIIKKDIELVKAGISVFVYPEGTRNAHPDEFLEFAKGSFKIAQRTNCPIVPVTMVGSRDVLEHHFPKIRSAKVIMEYGEPFRFSDLTPEQQKTIHTYTSNLIKERYLVHKKSLELPR